MTKVQKPAQQQPYRASIVYSTEPVRGINVYADRRRELTLTEIMDRLGQRDLEDAQREELLAKLQLRTAEMQQRFARYRMGEPLPEAKMQKADEKPKRFLVSEGEIIRDDENGEYSFAQALALARTQKGGSEMSTIVSTVLDAMKPGQQTTLEDIRGLAKDLQEAGRHTDGISPTELDLRFQNMRLQQQQETQAMLRDIQARQTPATEHNEPPFFINDGKITLNPEARLTAQDVLIYQMLNASQPQSLVEHQGRVYQLDDFFKIEGFKADQRRKDEDSKFKKDALQLAKEQAPKVIGVLRNLVGPEGEAREGLTKGGWTTEGRAAAPEVPQLAQGTCTNCRQPLVYASGTRLITCPQCHEEVFLGTPDDLRKELEQWSKFLEESPSSSSSEPKGSAEPS